MRIGIDVRMLEASSGLTGIAIGLLETMRELNDIDHTNKYFLFSRKKINCDICFKKNWNLIVKDFPQGMIWYNTVLIHLLKQYRIDVFWNANHILPVIKVRGCKYIVTVHDVAIFKLKGIGEYSNIVKQRIFLKRSCKNAYIVITVSEATKNDLIEVMNVDSSKIFVNMCGGLSGGNVMPSLTKQKQTLHRLGIEKEYFLFLGTLEPRKNLITLVKAFELYRQSGVGEEDLVIAGGKGWRFEETQNYIDKSIWKGRIHQLGYVSNEEKVVLLQNSVAFIFPSLYEGFGVPILEAMESGVPVITSKVSSMPEVGGEAAFYIDNPTDEVDLAAKMDDVAHLNRVEREQLRNTEAQWVKHFSWRKTAEGFLNLISKCI